MKYSYHPCKWVTASALLFSVWTFLFLAKMPVYSQGTNSTSSVTNSVSKTEQSNPDVFYIDRMDTVKNLLEGRCATYRMPPDNIMFTKGPGYGRDGGPGLKLIYKKINVGGPYGQGGWAGYYTILRKGSKYFDASQFTHLTFWVRGEVGGERFKVGVADKQFGMIEDSVKSKPIDAYLPAGKVTTEWQKAVIPLSDMFVDYNLVDSISLNFESDLFDTEEANGTVYLDDLAFEKINQPENADKATKTSK